MLSESSWAVLLKKTKKEHFLFLRLEFGISELGHAVNFHAINHLDKYRKMLFFGCVCCLADLPTDG